MTSTLAAFAARLVDFYLWTTLLLLGTAGVVLALRQPARRLAAGSAALGGLALLAALAAVPFYPRVPLPSLCAGLQSVWGKTVAVGPRSESPSESAVVPLVPQPAQKQQKLSELPPTSSTTATRFDLVWLQERTPAALAILFLVVSAALTARLFRGAIQAGRLRVGTLPPPRWLAEELSRLLGRQQHRVLLALSPEIDAPVAVGVWRPMILLPMSLSQKAGRERLLAVLAHEWAHIRHGDLWRLAMSRWLFVLLFANPIYWWLRRVIRRDEELLADAAAVADTGLSAREYAEILVGWARHSIRPLPLTAAALGIWERPSPLTRRIAMLLDERFHVEAGTPRRWRYGGFVVAAFCAIGLSILTLFNRPPVEAAEPAQPAGATPAAKQKPEPPADKGTLGATKQSERAIAAALNWIARHQARDGRWSFQYVDLCKDSTCNSAGTSKADPAASGLAVLAFLAAGQTQQTRGPYQKTISSGLQWLVQGQAADGRLSQSDPPTMYVHGIAALALCEAYGLTRDNALAAPAQKAIDFIEAAQNRATGGWRYNPGDPGDTSVFGWQLLAIQSGQLAGLRVKHATFEGAQKYLKTVAKGEHGGKFSYVPGSGPSLTMTAVGVLTEGFLGIKPSDPAVVEGIQFLMTALPDVATRTSRRDSYHWFFATQALHNLSGTDWDTWNRKLRRTLIDTQVKEGCASGSWDPEKPVRDTWSPIGGRLMVTALSTLNLETYYRYLPIYKIDVSKAKPASEPGR